MIESLIYWIDWTAFGTMMDWLTDWTAFGTYEKGSYLFVFFFMFGLPTSIVAVTLTIIGVMFAPLGAWNELCHHQRPLKTSVRQAVIAAARACALLLPYWLSRRVGSSRGEFRRLLLWFYGFTYATWLFGVTLLWLYNLRNIRYGEYIITVSEWESVAYFTASMFPHRTHEEAVTLIAFAAVSLTCLYSVVYTWRADHVERLISDEIGGEHEHRNKYSIAPFAWTAAWLWLGIADHVAAEPDILGRFPFYYLAIPLAAAGGVWIGVTARNWAHRETMLRRMKAEDVS